ncbi:hypothetical protein [Serratia fonticola]|uniref:hypothetical protein n=1 Tax=Serratia fonticola TaxID=47917 RepID=UPI0021BDD37D|nr:hypothetical protein [Serratia fonticola]
MRIFLNVIMKMLWVVCILFIVMGSLYSISVMEKAEGVMQQIYALTFAMTFAVVPYCVCRAIQMILRHDDSIKREKKSTVSEGVEK